MKHKLRTAGKTKILFAQLFLLMIYTRKGRRLIKRREKLAELRFNREKLSLPSSGLVNKKTSAPGAL